MQIPKMVTRLISPFIQALCNVALAPPSKRQSISPSFIFGCHCHVLCTTECSGSDSKLVESLGLKRPFALPQEPCLATLQTSPVEPAEWHHSSYLLLHNKPPQTQCLKTTIIIHFPYKWALWAGPGRDHSSLLPTALARAAQRLGVTHLGPGVIEVSLTCLLADAGCQVGPRLGPWGWTPSCSLSLWLLDFLIALEVGSKRKVMTGRKWKLPVSQG